MKDATAVLAGIISCFQENSEYLGGLVTAAIGTFFGAYAAFALEKNSRQAEAISSQANDGNLTNLALFQIWNDLRQFQKEILEPLTSRETAWLAMRASFPRQESSLEINANKLAFLFKGKDKNLLPEILLEQIRYKLLLDMINRRSNLMLEKVFPKMESQGIKPNENIDARIVEVMIGPALTAEIKDLSAEIINHATSNLDSLKVTSEKLRKQLIELFPKEKILKIGFDEKGENYSATEK